MGIVLSLLLLVASTAWAGYSPGQTQFFSNSRATNFSNTITQYISIAGSTAPNAAEGNIQTLGPRFMPTLLACSASGDPGAGNSYTWTARSDGSNTDWACALPSPGPSCSDTAGSIVAAGLWSIDSVPASTPTGLSTRCTFSGAVR